MIDVFIGYDNREKVAYHVLSESLINYSSKPLKITPIATNNLQDIFKRENNTSASTEFSFSRFLVPHLMGYEGWALFMDCDMLVYKDINELWELRDEKYAVQVCKHNYIPKDSIKFLGQPQISYPKKNWSSFMLMNCGMCKDLTLDYVNKASGLELHQFKWLESDHLIGTLPLEWNWLEGEYDYKEDICNVHFTRGGPYFKEYKDCDYSKDWFNIFNNLKINL